MRHTLKNYWQLVLSLLFFVLALLFFVCWLLYATKNIVVYPLIHLYDYTDAGLDIGNTFNIVDVCLCFFLAGLSLFLFWRWHRTDGPARKRLLIFAILMLVLTLPWMPWLFSHSLFNAPGGTLLNQQDGHMYYWSDRMDHYPDTSDPDTLRDSFRCDDLHLFCSYSSTTRFAGP